MRNSNNLRRDLMLPNRCCILVAAWLLALSGCTTSAPSLTEQQATVDYNLLYTLPAEPVPFDGRVRPVLERRCVVCHGCYDAPCQLKLSSPAGIRRGASKEVVYDGARIRAAEPTRLFIDAVTTAQWRDREFFAVLHEPGTDAVDSRGNAELNLENSVLYRMLRLKELHPQARTGMLSDDFDVGLNRDQTCPSLEEFDDYAAKHPRGGMPYAMPNLSRAEYTTLVHWLAQGSPMPPDKAPSKEVAPQIARWEEFLNGPGNKQQLVSRYIYEHLFQAHLHFHGSEKREFYRMVRSRTAPGQPVEVLATLRPYGDPQGPVWYRIVRHQGSIVAKDHLVYELSDQRMQRYRELFLKPDYAVDELPSWDNSVASNPIKAFADLPVDSRYRFLLDDARFFIEGFIKGPVCRGQIALNVIEDQFWVVFFDPKAPLATKSPAYLNAMADYLASPSELEDNFRLLIGRRHYRKLHEKYQLARQSWSSTPRPRPIAEAMDFIWDGDGTNPNAALTVFRHLDSASVNFGFIGDYPDTAWIIDYPLLERIHYLLVAGFSVYGNVGHQLNTRLYMDFLRMEGEDYFLAFLPADRRKAIRDSWYTGIRKGMERDDAIEWWINLEVVTGYRSDDPQRELYRHLEQRLGALAGGGDYINRCGPAASCTAPKLPADVLRVDRAMQKAARMDGRIVEFLPDVAFLRVRMGGAPEKDLAYTLISNKAYTSVTSMFQDETLVDRRDYESDTQTVVRWLEGSYPNFFYVVDLDEVERFVERYNDTATREDYERFVARYGLRRTSLEFWQTSDWFHDQYAREQPLRAGLFDLNRYQNR